MSFNLTDFKSRLRNGGAKASLFEVRIINPIDPTGQADLPFLCQAAQIPESTIGTIEVPYFGRKIKIAGDRTFGEWTVTIINDEDFRIRNSMERWMADINRHEVNLNQAGPRPNDYKSRGEVIQYGKNGDILRNYTFDGIFPTNVAAITLDWDTTDDIERFDVTFQFDWWEITGGNTFTDTMS